MKINQQVITGARTALSGTHGYTATSQLLHKTGMSYRTAGCIDNGISLFGSIGGMAAMQSSRVAANTWRLPSFGEMSAQNNFKPFNQRNFRSNLIESTGVSPGKNAQAHHVFPQKFRKDFIQRNINIHDPKYGTWWETKSHLSNAHKYNMTWKEYIYANPYATKNQMLEEGKRLMTEYQINVNY